MIISFEGIDGSGKSTQAQMLKEYLATKGNYVYYTREPGWDSEVSEIMRTLIMSVHTSPRQKLFLLLADRAAHFDKKIGPILSKDHFNSMNFPEEPFVIMDRGIDSLVAYQGFGQQLAGVNWLAEANRLATGGMTPALTFLIDMKIEDAIARSKKLNNSDGYNKAFYEKVREGYAVIAKAEPYRVIVLDGTKPPKEIHKQVVEAIHKKMQEQKNPAPNMYI